MTCKSIKSSPAWCHVTTGHRRRELLCQCGDLCCWGQVSALDTLTTAFLQLSACWSSWQLIGTLFSPTGAVSSQVAPLSQILAFSVIISRKTTIVVVFRPSNLLNCSNNKLHFLTPFKVDTISYLMKTK